ncbi:hypothetical protein R3Q08_07455 [Rhodococcus erythropolis]|uniref:hypothetical protein n=1 Tax=Rhodococcus TaxID=1827 RepID=UPI00038E452C|nr:MULTISPECIES: hypothetical protein [Rhodococcus]EQM31816.1 hypothetical protein N601_20185 [Rhodococcus erythropolis DN1]MDV6208067.1 hypothetical protein [Rhodococcus erythropolis]OFE06754.1 hypothetical protein A5N83_20730 [Rhodococcus sp. 1139]RAL33779.1 hypothetical protein CVN56_12455 [Rhodococcus sp. AQ5-07]
MTPQHRFNRVSSTTIVSTVAVLASLIIAMLMMLTFAPTSSATPEEDCAAVRARDHQIYLNLVASLPPGSPIPPEVINPCLTAPSTTASPTPTTTIGLPGAQAPGGGPNVGANAPTNFPTYNGTPIVPVPTIGVPPLSSESPTSEAGTGASPNASTPAVPSPTLTPTPGEGTATTERTPMPAATTSGSAPTQVDPAPVVANSGLDEEDGRNRYLELVLVGAAAFTVGGIGVRGRRSPFGSRTPESVLARVVGTVAQPVLRYAPGGYEQITIPNGSGGERTLVLINDPTSPRTYRFPQQVPPGGQMIKNADGSVSILDADGREQSHVNPPWAYDALGRPVRTEYEVDGDTIVQTIYPTGDSIYPILADPDKCTIDDPNADGSIPSLRNASTENPDGSVTTDTYDRVGNHTQAQSTVVPDSGGTVDTTIANADGTQTETRSVPDGNGGVTTWSSNPDGSNTVLYPDGSYYEEPAAGSDKGYTQGQVTDTGTESTYTDRSGNQYTSQSTYTPDGVHTETDTPQGHVTGDSEVTPGSSIITKAVDPQGNPVVTRSVANGDGTVDTHQIVAQTVDDQGNVVYLQEDGTLFTPDIGNGTSSVTTTDDDGTITVDGSDHSRLIFLPGGGVIAWDANGLDITDTLNKQIERWPQRLAQGGAAGAKFVVNRNLASTLSAMGNLTAQLQRGQAVLDASTDFDAAWLAAQRTVTQNGTKLVPLDAAAAKLGLASKVLGRSAIILAPVGMYFDIKQGVRPGQAITSGTAGVVGGIAGAAAIAAGATALGVAAPALAVAGGAALIGVGAYMGTKWAYGKLPDSWQDGVDSGLRSTWSGIKGLFQ